MSRLQKSLVIRTIFFLFALNTFFLALYLLLVYQDPIPSRGTLLQTVPLPTLKPWPNLPSFIPWIPNPNPPLRSCEAYFGNGFSTEVIPLAKSGIGGWFRCLYSETLRSSVCEGSRVRMDPRKIHMSEGGEGLELVMGRREEEELPRFDDGAFEIEGGGDEASISGRVVDDEFLDRYVQRNGINYHTMRGLMKSMRIVGSGELQCSQWIEEPTLVVTRFEYANLFHTVTDWYSAYVSSRVTNLPNRPHLILVDGHCKSPLEETWETLFTSTRYAKNFSASVCFRHVVFSPLGYETAMFKGLSESFICQGSPASHLRKNPNIRKTSRLSEFGEMLRAAFDLPADENSIVISPRVHNILFVRREDYLPHPRHTGKVESRLSNEPEVFESIRNWASNQTRCRLNVVNGLFAHMSMKDQLEAIYGASVVIGAHGAGLTHLVSARSNTIVLEIISSQYRRPHFSLISKWKGLEYHVINLQGSYAKPEDALDELRLIVRRSLGCI